MRKFFALTLALVLAAGVLMGCSKQNTPGKSGKLSIVTTIFPEYDWVKEILGEQADEVEVTVLLDSSVDLHSYQPTADDMIRIADCDLFIYVGGESDDWVDGALRNTSSSDRKVIKLLEVLGDAAREEEIVEGMQAGTEEHSGKEDAEFDEHVWLSLKNAGVFCLAIADALAELDPANQDIYMANASAYIDKLSTLDEAYQRVVESAPRKTILFGDRFPFRYLADDYGLTYYAAFAGCSAETEASFETISFLARKIDELQLPCVLTIEGVQHSIAETIVRNTVEQNQKILTMDSMQSITSGDAPAGVSYLSIMEKNLSILKEALN